MRIEIRSLKKDDPFEDLISLSRDFFGEYEGYHQEFFKLDRLNDKDIQAYFTHWLEAEHGGVFIALDKDRIVGYITVVVTTQEPFWKIKKIGHISGLMVHQAYRRLGIGIQLMEKGKDFFEAEAVKYFTVYTAVSNREAIIFYECNGMVPLYTTLFGEISKPVD